MEKYCEWIKYDYRTICPREHDANNPYWRIPADTDKFKILSILWEKIVIIE